MIDQNRSYEQGSVERALTCANCGQKLHVLEVHMCEHCCAELMSDPNSSMYEEEDDEHKRTKPHQRTARLAEWLA